MLGASLAILGHIGVMMAILGLFWAILGSTWLSWGAILVDLEDVPRDLGGNGCPTRFGGSWPVSGGVPRGLGGPVGRKDKGTNAPHG
jgi:hypothetical protein